MLFIKLSVVCHYFTPGVWSRSKPHSITNLRPTAHYTGWWQKHIGVNRLCRSLCSRGSLTAQLMTASSEVKRTSILTAHQLTAHVSRWNMQTLTTRPPCDVSETAVDSAASDHLLTSSDSTSAAAAAAAAAGGGGFDCRWVPATEPAQVDSKIPVNTKC